MKNKKLRLDALKVQSFVTFIGEAGKQTIKGQDPGGITALCAESQVCPTREMNGSGCRDYTLDCNDTKNVGGLPGLEPPRSNNCYTGLEVPGLCSVGGIPNL